MPACLPGDDDDDDDADYGHNDGVKKKAHHDDDDVPFPLHLFSYLNDSIWPDATMYYTG